MVRGHQGCTLIDLKTRMQAEHGSPWKQTENTVARLYRLGLLQNRSTLGHIPCICTPGCKSLPAQVTPNLRSVLAQQATTEKRLKAKAAKAAALAASAPRQQATQPEPNRTTGHLSKGSAAQLCAPRVANARDLVEHIICLLLTLGEDERLDAEQVATRLGIPVEVTAVRDALSKMSYHGKVRSRYNAERTRLLYSIDPRTAELLRQKAQQATQPARRQTSHRHSARRGHGGQRGRRRRRYQARPVQPRRAAMRPGRCKSIPALPQSAQRPARGLRRNSRHVYRRSRAYCAHTTTAEAMNTEPTKQILDACCGGRMMWFDRQNPSVVFGDQRSAQITVTDNSRGNKSGTRTININPDVLFDFRALPFDDGAFKLVAFDPPHLVQAGPRSWLAAKYGKLSENWRDDLRQGFAECFRVLASDGVLVFKWARTGLFL